MGDDLAWDTGSNAICCTLCTPSTYCDDDVELAGPGGVVQSETVFDCLIRRGLESA